MFSLNNWWTRQKKQQESELSTTSVNRPCPGCTFHHGTNKNIHAFSASAKRTLAASLKPTLNQTTTLRTRDGTQLNSVCLLHTHSWESASFHLQHRKSGTELRMAEQKPHNTLQLGTSTQKAVSLSCQTLGHSKTLLIMCGSQRTS